MSEDNITDAIADLANISVNAERMKEKKLISRLKDLGWQDFTIRERMILKKHKDEYADKLYKAFEHKKMGTVYCYSIEEVEAFLKHVEAN